MQSNPKSYLFINIEMHKSHVIIRLYETLGLIKRRKNRKKYQLS